MFDIIEVEMTCNKTSVVECLEYSICKFDFYCTNYMREEIAVMVYTEGE